MESQQHVHSMEQSSLMPTSDVKPVLFCLFLGDLSVFCSETDISDAFQKFGEIAGVRIIRNRNTKKNLSYGFIEFTNVSAAIQAMNEMNGKILCGRSIRIRWASTVTPKDQLATDEDLQNRNQFSLFLGTLSELCTEQDIINAFSPYGTLLNVRIKKNKTEKRGSSYGFVEFADADSAVYAMNSMDGKLLCGQVLRIRWASGGVNNKKNKKPLAPKLDDTRTVSLFISFSALNEQSLANEETLRTLFSKYGDLMDVAIRLSVIDKESKCQKGYAFICFQPDQSGINASLKAHNDFTDVVLDNIHYKSEISKSLEGILNSKMRNAPGNNFSSHINPSHTSNTPQNIPASYYQIPNQAPQNENRPLPSYPSENNQWVNPQQPSGRYWRPQDQNQVQQIPQPPLFSMAYPSTQGVPIPVHGGYMPNLRSMSFPPPPQISGEYLNPYGSRYMQQQQQQQPHAQDRFYK